MVDRLNLTRENRAWPEGRSLPASAREQIAVALAMIDALDALDALDAQSAPGRRDDPRRARRRAALLLLAPRHPLRRAGHHGP
jgi:hypothetical protein